MPPIFNERINPSPRYSCRRHPGSQAMPGFGVAKSPQGRAVCRQARPNIFENCEACCGFFGCAISSKYRIARPRWRSRASPAGTKSGLWGGDDVAVRPSRHQAILHLAGRRQIVSQPQSERQDRNRDRQPGDRSTPVSALFGIGHLSVSPGNGEYEATQRRGSIIARSLMALTFPQIALRTGARSAPSRLMRLFMRLCPPRHSCFVPLKEPSF
jgi:hypothetical protein